MALFLGGCDGTVLDVGWYGNSRCCRRISMLAVLDRFAIGRHVVVRPGDLVGLRILRDGTEREVDLYHSLSEKVYDPSGKMSSLQIALVVSHETRRFVRVLCPTGLGWVSVAELGLILRRAGANPGLDDVP